MDAKLRLKLCKNDEDRVKVILNDANEALCAIGECRDERKSPEKSEKFRHAGNFLLNSISPNLEEVLKLYAKSILYAPPGSEQLSLAYANRSAVLFRAKYYEECLEDISRALETGYPDSLKPKLLIRRVTCNYALTGNVDFETDEGLIEARALIAKLPATNNVRKMVEDTLNNPEKITFVGRQVKKTCLKYQPEMRGKNPHLPGASDAIALRYSEEFGRHLVATRNINSGEVLLIEKPYATIVADEWIYCICSHCAMRTWNGIPCNNCAHAMFCSAECKQAAWEEYHDVECGILGFTEKFEYLNDGLMGLRLTVKAIKEAGSVDDLRKRLKELDSVEASDVEIPINPNSYETFYIMSDNPERHDLERMVTFSFSAVRLAYFLAVRTNLLGKKIADNLQVVKDSEPFLFVAGLMMKNLRIASNRTSVWAEGVGKNPEDYKIIVLPSVFNFLNNRCYGAAEKFFIDENLILVTYVPISKGDQVFISYGMNYWNDPRDLRQKTFNDVWQFKCNCLACEENWSKATSILLTDQDLPLSLKEELSNKMRRIKYPSSLDENSDVEELIQVKEQCCRVMDFMYPQVKKPSINVELIANMIGIIYTALGEMKYPRFIGKSSWDCEMISNFIAGISP